ncbi:MAG: hypothetical protein IK083_00550 [Abditibacteriota bacterium]|nr:hypothetical protein [Abditibacteriota bacterium]
MSRDIYELIHKNRGGLFMTGGGFAGGFLMFLCGCPLREWGSFFFRGLLKIKPGPAAVYINLFNLAGVAGLLLWQRGLLLARPLELLEMFLAAVLASFAGARLLTAAGLKAVRWGICLWILALLTGILGCCLHFELPWPAVCAAGGFAAGLAGIPAAAVLPVAAASSGDFYCYVCVCACMTLLAALLRLARERAAVDKRIIFYFAAGMLLGFGAICGLARVKCGIPTAALCFGALFIWLKIRETALLAHREKQHEK